MTKVEEWTREETGVGATIAMGSQGEKGKIALFVKADKTKNTLVIEESISIRYCPIMLLSITLERTIIRAISPKRFKNIVNTLGPIEKLLLKKEIKKKDVTLSKSQEISIDIISTEKIIIDILTMKDSKIYMNNFI